MNSKELIPRLLNILAALSVACIALLIALIATGYMLAKDKVQGYAASDSGRVIPLISLDQPYVTDARVTGFVEECLRRSFAHDFENYRLTMASAKDCYTPVGAEQFEAAMNPLLTDILNRSLVMSASLEPTVVTRVFSVNGIVHWTTQTPMVLQRRGGRESLTSVRFNIESVVQRIPLDHHVRGIALRSINMRPR